MDSPSADKHSAWKAIEAIHSILLAGDPGENPTVRLLPLAEEVMRLLDEGRNPFAIMFMMEGYHISLEKYIEKLGGGTIQSNSGYSERRVEVADKVANRVKEILRDVFTGEVRRDGQFGEVAFLLGNRMTIG